jgi:hypothetical protein
MSQSSQSRGQRFSYALAGERFFAIDFSLCAVIENVNLSL